MKRTLLFITCVLASMTMWAQEDSNDYIPFVELGKQWHVVSNPTNPYAPCSFERYEMYEEVERDGKTYVHLGRTGFVVDTLYQEEGLFREENRRVYKYEGGKEVMLYDFSLKEGDTFTYEYGVLGEPMNCKVLKQGWLEDGPQIQMLDSLTSKGAWTFKYRKLRTWTIGLDNGSGDYTEATTWIEGVGTLKNTFIRPYTTGVMSCLAYIYRIDRPGDNDYLPFSLCNMYGPVYGCELPKGVPDNLEDWHEQFSYELEGDRLHVWGNLVLNCGGYYYAYFTEERTDDPMVRKLHFRIEELGQLTTCMSHYTTDFYVSGLNPNINYIIVDNIGEEHPVINKTPEQTNTPDTSKYFPTGMTWEEVNVNPSMEFEYENAHIYEIGTDTIIGNVTYKKVLKDNVFSGLCVRESGDKVWLLTKDYPTEILLYNFDWDNNQEVVTEYLKGQEVIGFIGQNEVAYEVRQETTLIGNCQTVIIDGKTYQYYKKFSGTIIRGIGKVAELNRYPCLLSYREPAVILPGMDYFKVRWIKRNGVEIFRSESAKEWTAGIMDDFRPFVEEGKVWKVGTIPYDLDTPVQIVDYYYFDGDTIIDGKTCKMMMCQHFTSPNYPYYEYLSQPNSLRYVGAWYEENQKVYFYDERTQSMVMKYDFSLGANETVSLLGDYLPFIIGPKQTGGLDGFKGVYRDVMICVNEDQIANNTIWLEGVGGIDGPTKNAYYIDTLDDRVPEFLMACVVGDEVIFLNDKYEDEATPAGARKNRFDFTHTNKLKPKSRVRSEEEPSLYGEYNDHQLDINLDPLDDAYQVSITDGSGKAVYEKVINAGNIVALNIDISAYAKDHYTVTVENSRESFSGEFETLTNGISDAVRLNDKGKIINDKRIYNLQGQRLSRLQKGLNIVNGKKIYVRN